MRLLSMPHMLGFGFNPVSFLFLYDEGGERVESVIAEVTNTLGDRHAYVARRGTEAGPILARFGPSACTCPLQLGGPVLRGGGQRPGRSLEISIRNRQRGGRCSSPVWRWARRLSRAEMTRVMRSYPPFPLPWRRSPHLLARPAAELKGVPHHPHPEARAPTG